MMRRFLLFAGLLAFVVGALVWNQIYGAEPEWKEYEFKVPGTTFGGTLLLRERPAPTPVDPTDPPGPIEPDPDRFDLARLEYLGSFRAPAGAAFGGYAAGVDEPTGDLWLAGFDKEPHNRIACLKVPELGTAADPAALPVATVVTDWFDPLTPEQRPGDHFTIRGLLPYGDKLIGTGFVQYDNPPFNQLGSHWLLDPGQQQARGLYQFSVSPSDGIPIYTSREGVKVDATSGFVGGYLAAVPEKWQAEFGKVICGHSAGSIVIRRSTGPSAFGFDPDDLGTKSPVPARSLVYYPSDGKSWPNSTSPTAYFPNTEESPHEWLRGCTANGAAFLDNGLLFVGSEDTGVVGYNVLPEGRKHRILAYDPAELARVVSGELKPWEPRPYAERVLNEHPILLDKEKFITAAAFDRTRGRLYVVQGAGYAAPNVRLPVVHVYKVE